MRRPLKRLVGTLLLAVWAPAGPASGAASGQAADPVSQVVGLDLDDPCEANRFLSGLVCGGDENEEAPGSEGTGGAGRVPVPDGPGPDRLPITYLPLPEGVEEEVCTFNPLGQPVCFVQPGPETEEAEAAEAARTVATSYWRDVPLPAPEPWIAPGRAITGLYAYLETRGTTTFTFTEPGTPFGPLRIEATGTYYVDWGDGTRTGPHRGEGGPWPDGRIRHEYLHIGSYDVVVTEVWSATWSFGDGRQGRLQELRTVGRIDDFPVQQIQAVVLR